MRSLCLSLVLLTLAVFPSLGRAAGAPAQGTSPAQLSNARFYTPEFTAKVYSGEFDPFEFWSHTPLSVQFQAPGRLLIDWGQETETCSFTASGSGAEWSLSLDCGGTPKHATWSWLAEGRVRTDLAADQPEVMVFLPQSFEEIAVQHAQRFSDKKLPELVGIYRDATGAQLILSPDGTISLANKGYQATVLECLAQGAAAQLPHVPCLQLDTGAAPLILAALPADSGAVLVEGTLPEDTGADGRAFVPLPKGRRFLRDPPPVSKETP